MLKASKNIEAETFVVDNNSSDGSREYLESKFPEVIFKWGKENVGFAKANNSVLSEVKGSHVLFLNPDTILPEDCFEKCLAFFKLRENCGALGVKMIDGSGNFLKESKRALPSASASFYKMIGLSAIFPHSKIFSKYYAGELPEDKINAVDVLAGAFFMVNKKLIDKTGGFDENFFMYGEDIDLAYRIQKEGFKNYYFPDTSIVHFKGESTRKQSRFYIRHFYGAMHLFVKKHYHNGMHQYFIDAAIGISKSLGYIKLYLTRAFGRKTISNNGNRETLVIASQPYFNEMIQLIKYAADPVVIQGRIAINDNDKDTAEGMIDNIETIITKNRTSKIIFCEEPLSFKMMIGLMQQLKGKTGFLFHAKRSESIVGSDNKNEQGIFIAK